jgi:hypothetical protein
MSRFMQERSSNKTPNGVEPASNGDPVKQETAVLPATKNPHAIALGQLGGKRGGAARAKALSPARRHEIARKAAAARWKREKSE